MDDYVTLCARANPDCRNKPRPAESDCYLCLAEFLQALAYERTHGRRDMPVKEYQKMHQRFKAVDRQAAECVTEEKIAHG